MALLGSNDNLPVTQVKALSDRGYSENDIKDILRKKGYSENEINLTIQKAVAAKVGSAPKEPLLPISSQPVQQQQAQPVQQHEEQAPLPDHHDDQLLDTKSLFGSIGARQQDLIAGADHAPENPSVPTTPSHDEHMEGYEIDLEPIVEAIVEERWNDTAAILADVQERLDSLEALSKGGMKLDEVAQLEYLTKQVQERVERLEQSLDDVTIKVNSIEKAFKQFIPSLTGNIKALSEAVRHIRVGDSQEQ